MDHGTALVWKNISVNICFWWWIFYSGIPFLPKTFRNCIFSDLFLHSCNHGKCVMRGSEQIKKRI